MPSGETFSGSGSAICVICRAPAAASVQALGPLSLNVCAKHELVAQGGVALLKYSSERLISARGPAVLAWAQQLRARFTR